MSPKSQILTSSQTAATSAQCWHQLIDNSLTCADPVLFDALQHAARQSAAQQSTPRLIHLCGLPGSGKTTYANSLMETHPGFWHLQFDHIMQSLPDYQITLQNEGPVAAFTQWEKPAAQMGYRLLKTVLAEKRNVLFDHSAAHPVHAALLTFCKERGYHIEMHYLGTPIDIVRNRVLEREKDSGRHTPNALIEERERLLHHLLPAYRRLADRFIEVAPQHTR